MSIKRYDLVAASEGRALDGKWVKYDDHVAEVERLAAELAAARAERDNYQQAMKDAVKVRLDLTGHLAAARAQRDEAGKDRYKLAGDLLTARAERDGLAEALLNTLANLVAATSLLKAGGKAAKKGAPSDKMFDQMVRDYEASAKRACAALADLPPKEDDDGA